ncbi:MAG: hypothetical protein DMF09_08435 [Verrucomicrobia bacterium]|nr:MAG: hypothetical protein DMF09_08435 [Verrucomicrobiota bacterium]
MAQLCKLRAVKNASYKLAPQATDFMSNRANHNSSAVAALCERRKTRSAELLQTFPAVIDRRYRV